MAIISLKKYTKVEKILLQLHTEFLNMATGNIKEAKKDAVACLDKAISESKIEGTYCLPINFGDIMLDDKFDLTGFKFQNFLIAMRKQIPIKYEEGVTDEDIKWWWNQFDIERRMIVKQDETTRGALWLQVFLNSFEINDKKRAVEAACQVRKAFPMFGDPNDTIHTSGQDRPLPYELKLRVNNYVQEHMGINQEIIKTRLMDFSTFNAFVRQEIKAGNI